MPEGDPLENRDQGLPVEGETYPDADGNRYSHYTHAVFEELNAHTIFKDTEAQRGGYVPLNGALFVEEDTLDFYLGDGANWNYLEHLSELITHDHSDNANGGGTLNPVALGGEITSTTITNLEGDNLSVDTSGNLNSTGGSLGEHDHSDSDSGGNQLNPGILNGTLVPRSTPISNLAGNIYVVDDDTDPTQADGDVVFRV